MSKRPDQIRAALGEALRLARGAQSVHAAGRSGVGYRTIGRLEAAERERVGLDELYLLGVHYDVSLYALLASVSGPFVARPWPLGVPPLPDTDEHLRRRFRALRLAAQLGTPALGSSTGVHQSWIVRYESGEVLTDVVRLTLMAEALGEPIAALLPAPFTPESR